MRFNMQEGKFTLNAFSLEIYRNSDNAVVIRHTDNALGDDSDFIVIAEEQLENVILALQTIPTLAT